MHTTHRPASLGTFAHPTGRLTMLARPYRSRRATPTIYRISDQLHAGHMACVRGDEIAATVSAWLADLGAHSPLADDLSRAVNAGDWPTTHAISDRLSLDVAVAT
jgi:hypothetical protein